MKKIMIVNTSTNEYYGTAKETGLWLGELVHFYDVFNHEGFEIDLFSTSGGRIPIDPISVSPFMTDKTVKHYYNDQGFMEKLSQTKDISEADPSQYDCIYFTGGHGTMYDFPGNPLIQDTIMRIYHNAGIIAAVCHGVGALVDVKDTNGNYFVSNKQVTGFSNFEETLARRTDVVPFLLESKLKEQGAVYKKAVLPFTSFVVEDGRLITGQNPQSPKAVAEKVLHSI